MTITYNLEGNTKHKCGNPPIIKALIRTCNERIRKWPQLLSYAFWIDRIIYSSMTRYMPMELMIGQKPIIPIEEHVPT